MTNKLTTSAELAPETSGAQQQTAETPTENTAELFPDEATTDGKRPKKPDKIIEIPVKKEIKSKQKR